MKRILGFFGLLSVMAMMGCAAVVPGPTPAYVVTPWTTNAFATQGYSVNPTFLGPTNRGVSTFISLFGVNYEGTLSAVGGKVAATQGNTNGIPFWSGPGGSGGLANSLGSTTTGTNGDVLFVGTGGIPSWAVNTNGWLGNPRKLQLLAFGDSLTYGYYGPYSSWFGYLNTYSPWKYAGLSTNLSHAGDDMDTVSNAVIVGMAAYPLAGDTNGYAFIWGGANGYAYASPTVYVAGVSNLLDRVRTNGYKTVLFNIMGRTNYTGTTPELIRASINNQLARLTNADFYIDVARLFPNPMDPVMFFGDGTHLTIHAQTLLAQEVDFVLRNGPRNTTPYNYNLVSFLDNTSIRRYTGTELFCVYSNGLTTVNVGPMTINGGLTVTGTNSATSLESATYGAELVVNGTFDTDTANWTTNWGGCGVLFNSSDANRGYSMAVSNDTAAPAYAGQQILGITIGTKYRLSFWVKLIVGLLPSYIGVGTSFGGSENVAYYPGDNVWANYNVDFVATSTDIKIRLGPSSSVAGDYSLFDDVSIRQITGGDTRVYGNLVFSGKTAKSLIPATNIVDDLGSSTLYYRTGYISTLITTNIPIATVQYLNVQRTTDPAYLNAVNTGGSFYVGKEGSVADNILVGDYPYASIVSSPGTNQILFGVNDSVVMKMRTNNHITVTGNMGAALGAGNTNVLDFTFASRTTLVTNAITFAHATNAVASEHNSQVRWFTAGGAGPYTLTLPAWRTNMAQNVCAAITNGVVTKMIVECIGTCNDAATQTNCYVSFEYFK